MAFPPRVKFGIFMGPFHRIGDNPTLSLERDLELLQWLDQLGFDEAWIGEHHSGGWEIIASPEVFIATAAERTKHIKLGTGVLSLPYHHPLMVANRMVLLDHLTRGRSMMGVGPGTLLPDAHMIGSDSTIQRKRMEESLGVIIRLLTETEPITYESDWFVLRDAVAHLPPYTHPHFPIAVAASQSPSGVVLAGKHGLNLLSFSSIARDGAVTTKLKEFWKLGEDAAAEHGKTMDRANWRLTLPFVHLAESRKEAIEQARVGAGQLQRDYFENVLGFTPVNDGRGPADKIIDTQVDEGAWCIGTPDDMIAVMNRLDEESGGFGGVLIMAGEWVTREQNLRSYELIARYVMPHFQGSLVNLQTSAQWSAENRKELWDLNIKSLEKAKRDYAGKTKSG